MKYDISPESIRDSVKKCKIIKKYNMKMQKSKSEKKKEYYKACMEALFEGGEKISNFMYVLEEYATVQLKKKEIISNFIKNYINDYKWVEEKFNA